MDKKAPSQNNNKLFYSIGEVAKILQLNESTLRYWEKEFDCIHPRRTEKGIRQYTKKDIELLRTIRFLVKEKKMTLSGVRKNLRNNLKEITTQKELLDRLESISKELSDIRAALSDLEKGIED